MGAFLLNMNKQKFQNLCERVLIPKFDKIVRSRLRSLEEQTKSIADILDLTAGALARLEGMIDRFSSTGMGDESDRIIR